MSNQPLYYIKSANFTYKHALDTSPDPTYFFTHTHESPELLFMEQIDGSHIVEDAEFPLCPGDLVIVPPATYHQIRLHSNAPYERYNLLFNPELLGDIDTASIFSRMSVLHCGPGSNLAGLFRKTNYYYSHLSEAHFIDSINMIIKEIFYNLSILLPTYSMPHHAPSPLLSQAISYINAHLFTIQTVSEICQTLYVSESLLYETFKRQLNTSPKKYILAKRLHAARQQIATGARPGEIYEKVGFQYYSSFYRNYISFFGHSPSEKEDVGFSDEKYR